PITGMVMDLKVLADLIKTEVEDPFDHKNLNMQVPEFADLIPSAENIAVVIYNKLIKHLDKEKTLEIILYETPKNFVKYCG
ncbi:MAG: 6-carboxytetrahydropterin synthase, partial [Bacteroidota bacterium]|nr:6-carboxytetrahydropterin synthase [Bacteroidota bacterium]